MSIVEKGRRALLLGWTSVAGGFFINRHASAASLVQTASATEGPFYPKESMRPDDIDNDLVKIQGRVEQAGGEVITLRGQVKDTDGQALAGMRVEIWQCDVNGKYLHTGDSQAGNFDKGFQGFGHDKTNARGEYSFRTIKPTKYPGRTPHIHVKVCDEENDKELLTTQFYIDGDKGNANDFIFRGLSSDEAFAVSMRFVDGAEWPEAVIDIVV